MQILVLRNFPTACGHHFSTNCTVGPAPSLKHLVNLSTVIRGVLEIFGDTRPTPNPGITWGFKYVSQPPTWFFPFTHPIHPSFFPSLVLERIHLLFHHNQLLHLDLVINTKCKSSSRPSLARVHPPSYLYILKLVANLKQPSPLKSSPRIPSTM